MLWKLSKYEVDKSSSVSSKGLTGNFQGGFACDLEHTPEDVIILPLLRVPFKYQPPFETNFHTKTVQAPHVTL